MNIISANRMSVLTYVRTDMYLPKGHKRENYDGITRFQRFDCPDTDIRITLLTVKETGEAQKYCEAIEGAVRRVISVYATRPIGIRLYLLPAGFEFHERHASLGMVSPTLNLVAPIFEDHKKTLGNIVDLVSHESFHLMGYIAGDNRAADEHFAYWMGVCSQLSVLGEVRPETMPGGAIETDNDVFAQSSSAASVVRREVWPYSVDGEIQRANVKGVAMLEKCKELFSGQFKTPVK
ncbi:hypothetical protein XAV_17180 [Xanthomonas axonopodis pv. vasculorum]|uniref:hypothetical protein n=3 Tax=Xanthomonas axonopodis TaxID=53413 RepID=UPI001495E584|nr:hypothetical protein [Xanthomonas axonopodis]QKD87749.1 hypothetical protein XAV_17180 [Xanthomonas axonopodis pv. vasculorum]